MQYAIQTLKSIMKYVSTQEAEICVQINTFNETIKTIVDPVNVSPQNLPDILNTLNTIDADGSTNIPKCEIQIVHQLCDYTVFLHVILGYIFLYFIKEVFDCLFFCI